MIYISENKNEKISGNTSLYVTFAFNQEIVDIIKSEDASYYHKDKQVWEVPLTSLARLLDRLVYFDDVTFITNEDKNQDEDVKLSTQFKTTARDYQLEGIKYGLSHDKFLLLDEPGLGKTLMTMYLAEELQAREGLQHCLVICGLASLRTNWMKEIEKHSRLSGMMLGARINKNNRFVWDGIPKRVEQLLKPIDEFFVITNIETLRDERVIDAILKGPNKFDMMVIDEGHCIKSWKSIQGNNLLELSAKHQIIATGTPLLNNPLDTYMLLAWIGKESKRGITRFKNTYCILSQDVLGGIAGFKNLELLQDEIDACSIRRTKDILNLPPKNIIKEELIMNDAQTKFYQTIEKSTEEEADSEAKAEARKVCDLIKLKPHFLRSMFTRLRQAVACPQVLTSQKIDSCKVERAIELTKEILSNENEKVVIFSEFKEPVYRLAEALKEYNPLVNTGDISDAEFSSNIDKFQKEEKYRVFIGTTAKCGTGITLTRASYMIFIDTPWTHGEFEQACDRIHRIGTTKPVFIYNLICKDTVDEIVDYLLEKKSTLATFIVDKDVDPKLAWILKKCVPDSLFY